MKRCLWIIHKIPDAKEKEYSTYFHWKKEHDIR